MEAMLLSTLIDATYSCRIVVWDLEDGLIRYISLRVAGPTSVGIFGTRHVIGRTCDTAKFTFDCYVPDLLVQGLYRVPPRNEVGWNALRCFSESLMWVLPKTLQLKCPLRRRRRRS